MDDLIYEEFKGTGNMELHLSRTLQERRVFPAIDVGKSGTRHDELLLGEESMKRVTTLRHMLALLSDDERTLMLIDRMGKTESNAEFWKYLARINHSFILCENISPSLSMIYACGVEDGTPIF